MIYYKILPIHGSVVPHTSGDSSLDDGQSCFPSHIYIFEIHFIRYLDGAMSSHGNMDELQYEIPTISSATISILLNNLILNITNLNNIQHCCLILK